MSSNIRLSRDGVTRFTLALLAMAVLLATCTPLFAQTTISTGSIQGTVTDPSGAVLGGAQVTITSKDTGNVITVTTNSSGSYTSGALTPGAYEVAVKAQGFKTTNVPINVQVGVTSSANVKVQVGEASQVVEVQGSELAVNTEQATIQGVIGTEQIENLPANGRNFLDLAQLEPGVQIQDGGNFDPTKNGFSSISFGGRFGRTARIEVDGVDISDETVGTVTQNIPEGAIQEFQVQQSSLDLSTELTSSGSVNVTTKSGTNTLHGQGYYYFRDQNLDAALPGDSTNYFQRNQFGASVGGAIIKNKVFFFLDAERTKQDLLDPVVLTAPFTSLDGSFTSPFRESEGIAKLDWQISNNYKAFYRFSYDQNTSVLPFVPNSFQPFANVTHTPDHVVGLDFNTGSFTHAIRFGYTKFRNGITDAVTGSSIFNPGGAIELAIGADPNCLTAGADIFCSGPNFLAPQATYQTDHQVKYDGSKSYKSHIFRYGLGINHIQGGGDAEFLGTAPAVNALTLAAGQDVPCVTAANCPYPGGDSNPLNYPVTNVTLGNGQGFSSEKAAFGLPGGGLGPDNRFSWYIGDSWKVKPALTFTYGLRYVRDTGRTDSDVAAIPLVSQMFDNGYYSGLGNKVNQPNHNFAPQVGIAWDPSKAGKTVFRGGIGLFYENSIWNNNLFDRPARLASGLFLALQPACQDGNAQTFNLPGQTTSTTPTFCGNGETIGQAGPAIVALQQQYQAATVTAGPAVNPVYVGNALADGIDVTGTNLFAPNYVTPRSVQMNFGVQHEIRRGMVFTADYLRNISTHTLLTVDTNHVGAARYLNTTNATAAITATNASFGCGPGTAGIDCAIAEGATISDYATNGLDSANALCFGLPCASVGEPGAAFPGINQNVGTNQMLFPIGRSVYNGLQLSLKQDQKNPFPGIRYMNLEVSYSLSRYDSTARDSDFINFATDNDNPLKYVGPNGLDRTNQLSFGGTVDLPKSFRVSLAGHFFSPLPVNLTLNPTGNAGGIFVTDVTGDGTGDGTGASSGGVGDILPGTNVGAFGRSVNGGNINKVIQAYNTNYAGQPTPAGQALITAGLFSQAELVSLGGVQQPVPLAPAGEANMGWLKDVDLNFSWVYKIKERYELEPKVSFFNVFNMVNYDGPGSPLSGTLNGAIGSVNGTPGQQPDSNRLGLGSGVFGAGSPRVVEFSLKLTF
ncbi:MAG: TonB-dependent receptor [Terriglobales bacterium]